MAVAGGATTAYYVSWDGWLFEVVKTTTMKDMCTDVDKAVHNLKQGTKDAPRTDMVAGSDVEKVRELVMKGVQ